MEPKKIAVRAWKFLKLTRMPEGGIFFTRFGGIPRFHAAIFRNPDGRCPSAMPQRGFVLQPRR